MPSSPYVSNDCYEMLRRVERARRAFLGEYLKDAGLPALPVHGHSFLIALVGHLDFETDVMFSRWLIEEAGVIPLPPSAFCVEPASASKLVRP